MTDDQRSPVKQRRLGDSVKIPGNYQWLAEHSRNPIQRFWHYTKKSAIDALCPPTRNSFALDVGCGSGVISNYLSSKYGAKVIAIDGNSEAIDFGKAHFPAVDFRCALVDDDFDLDEEIGYVFCLELIEHIHEQQASELLHNFHRLLKPGGKLFLTTPNYRSAWPFIEKAMDSLGLAPPLAEHQHVAFYSPAKLVELVEKSGLHVETVRTNCFLAPWLSPLSLRLARWLDQKELGMKSRVGSIIVLVATKR